MLNVYVIELLGAIKKTYYMAAFIGKSDIWEPII